MSANFGPIDKVIAASVPSEIAKPIDRDAFEAALVRLHTLEAAAPDMQAVAAIEDRHDLAAIVPIATARKPRSRNWLASEIEQRRMRMVFHYSTPPYAEFWEGDRCLGRDPMPTTILLDDDRALFAMPLEAPGPNCLDAMSAALGLTDAERLEFGCRREDAKALHEAKAAEVQRELEKGAPMPPLEKP